MYPANVSPAERFSEPTWKFSDEETARYHADGLVVSPFRISPARLESMRECLERLLRDNADVAPESLVCPHIPNGPRHDAAAAGKWFEFATDPGMLDLVTQLIGPDVILWGSQVFCKPALTGREVPWHQDGQYWPIRPLATCSVWIALDDVSPENGCMRYIAGSHRNRGLLPHRIRSGTDIVLNQEVDPGSIDGATVMDDVLPAGEELFEELARGQFLIVIEIHAPGGVEKPRHHGGLDAESLRVLERYFGTPAGED